MRLRPRRRWRATIGTLVLGITVGAIAGITSRPTHLSVFDRGPDPVTTPPDLTSGTETAPEQERSTP